MREEFPDPRPSLPPELARVLTGPRVPEGLSADVIAQAWNDDPSYWSCLRRSGDWIDRARR